MFNLCLTAGPLSPFISARPAILSTCRNDSLVHAYRCFCEHVLGPYSARANQLTGCPRTPGMLQLG